MLAMLQVVQSMQRGKGLGRSKGRIKAVSTVLQKRLMLILMLMLTDVDADANADKCAKNSFKDKLETSFSTFLFRNLEITATCCSSLHADADFH